MKGLLILIAVLQAACFALWLMHSAFIKGDYADERYRHGVETGMIDYHKRLQSEGVEIPKPLGDVPSKDLMVAGSLNKDFHNLLVFGPACYLQGFIILLLVACIAKYKMLTTKQKN